MSINISVIGNISGKVSIIDFLSLEHTYEDLMEAVKKTAAYTVDMEGNFDGEKIPSFPNKQINYYDDVTGKNLSELGFTNDDENNKLTFTYWKY